ncbi:MAG: TetR/AcrR family transcriptional regulator [Acetobacteraceae bacterium]|jgi:AcrR family transcriptional regulator
MTIADEAPVGTPGRSLRERILGAAFCAFMEHGYAGASTLDIARRARVSKRDLYAQFGSKQAMLAACIAERTERMRMPLDLPVPCSREALAATLRAFGRTLLREVSRPEVLATHRLAIAEAEHAPELARTLDELGRAENFAALRNLLSAAQAAGLLGPGDVEAMADTFLALLWSGGLLTRLLLRVAAAPEEAECARRALFATEQVMRIYGALAGNGR